MQSKPYTTATVILLRRVRREQNYKIGTYDDGNGDSVDFVRCRICGKLHGFSPHQSDHSPHFMQLRRQTPAMQQTTFLAFACCARAHALITSQNPILNTHHKRIVDFTAKHRLAAIYSNPVFVHAGGLMSYAPDINANFRRAAIFVDKILKGAKPAELPVEQPTKFEFLINLKAAKQLGLTIPPHVLARADRVIK